MRLLLLLPLLLQWSSASSPAESPERLLFGASSRRSDGAACPCAYLERGGFWGSNVAAALGVKGGVYVESRCRCQQRSDCERQWRRSEKSLTFQWIGANGVRDSQMQLQFCSAVRPASLPACASGQVSFRLRQIGWWLDLQAALCRCLTPPQASEIPATATPAHPGSSISSFVYARPAPGSHGSAIDSRIVEFACDSKPTCQEAEPCFWEPAGPVGEAVRGSVLCACPPGSFCPIYLRPVPGNQTASAQTEPLDVAVGNYSEPAGTRLLCRLEPLT